MYLLISQILSQNRFYRVKIKEALEKLGNFGNHLIYFSEPRKADYIFKPFLADITIHSQGSRFSSLPWQSIPLLSIPFNEMSSPHLSCCNLSQFFLPFQLPRKISLSLPTAAISLNSLSSYAIPLLPTLDQKILIPSVCPH